ARDRPLDEHVRLGEVIARHAVSLVASADHAHAHREDGPYGFDPAAAAYDGRFQELVATGDFRPLAELVDAAKADSLWQLLVLHGGIASGGTMVGLVPLRDLGGGNWTAELRAPGFPGVYPVRVRAFNRYRETGAVVSILPKTLGPSASTAAGVLEAFREASP